VGVNGVYGKVRMIVPMRLGYVPSMKNM